MTKGREPRGRYPLRGSLYLATTRKKSMGNTMGKVLNGNSADTDTAPLWKASNRVTLDPIKTHLDMLEIRCLTVMLNIILLIITGLYYQ